MKLIVFDTEATDLTPGQICQLSYLMIEDGAVTGKNMYFAVDEMSEGAQEVHGMSIEDLDELSGGDRFEDRVDEIFADFSGCGLLVGHNVAADDRYIRVEFERCGLNRDEHEAARQYWPSQAAQAGGAGRILRPDPRIYRREVRRMVRRRRRGARFPL